MVIVRWPWVGKRTWQCGGSREHRGFGLACRAPALNPASGRFRARAHHSAAAEAKFTSLRVVDLNRPGRWSPSASAEAVRRLTLPESRQSRLLLAPATHIVQMPSRDTPARPVLLAAGGSLPPAGPTGRPRLRPVHDCRARRATGRVERVPPQANAVGTVVHAVLADTRREPGCLNCSLATDMGDSSPCGSRGVGFRGRLRRHVRSARFEALAGVMESAFAPPRVEFVLPTGTRGLEYAHGLRRVRRRPVNMPAATAREPSGTASTAVADRPQCRVRACARSRLESPLHAAPADDTRRRGRSATSGSI